MKAVWVCFMLLVCDGLAQETVTDHRFFLWQILEKYGHNGTIPYNGFEKLYKNLGLGNADSEVENNSTNSTNTDQKEQILDRTARDVAEKFNTKEADCTSEEQLAQLVVEHEEVSVSAVRPGAGLRQCLSPRELLRVYGLQQGELSAISFLHLCPAIVYQLDQGSCHTAGVGKLSSDLRQVTYASWFYASLAVFIISVSGLLCVGVVRLLQNTLFNQLITFLVALAFGTLLGDAFLHLIPHALGGHNELGEEESHQDSIMKTGLMFLTCVFFFMFEAVLNTVRSNKVDKDGKDKMTYVSVDTKENEKEMMELVKQVGHQHSHSHSHSQGDGKSNTAMMVIMGDGLHNLTDGLAIGAAFSGGLAPGFATAVAVFTHELPHELGDYAVLIQSGMSVRKAVCYNLFSSVLSFVGTYLGLFVGNFGDSTRWIYAITAGSFIYIALANLVPEINRQKSDGKTVVLRLCGMLCGGALMGSIALYEHDIQHLFS